MLGERNKKGKVIRFVIALIAIVFGVMTLKSGGAVLFGSEDARIAAGNYMPFVLWFNFVAGFFYIVAGVGIVLQKTWSVWLAAMIAVLTVLVFAAFGISNFLEVPYEVRTAGAMVLRSSVWLVIFTLAYKVLVSNKEATHEA